MYNIGKLISCTKTIKVTLNCKKKLLMTNKFFHFCVNSVGWGEGKLYGNVCVVEVADWFSHEMLEALALWFAQPYWVQTSDSDQIRSYPACDFF